MKIIKEHRIHVEIYLENSFAIIYEVVGRIEVAFKHFKSVQLLNAHT